MRSKDVVTVTEALLPLPFHSLLRCRAVCKLWGDIIDSPSFRQLYNEDVDDDDDANDDNDRRTVFLQLGFNFMSAGDFKVSIKVLDDEPLDIKHGLTEAFPTPRLSLGKEHVRIVGAVKGLICFNFLRFERPIAICNPILGLIKTLPPSLIETSTCQLVTRDVGIGFDSDSDSDYKVVELVYCIRHRRLHVHLYSRKTDSWRELGAGDGLNPSLRIVKSIAATSRHGRFAHWLASRRAGGNYEEMILSFDMKNEVFRAIKTMPDSRSMAVCLEQTHVVAKEDDRSFSLIILPDDVSYGDKKVRIYESSIYEIEGSDSDSELNWYDEKNVEQPSRGGEQVWRSGCVALKVYSAKAEPRLFIYDYRARRFIGCLDMLARNSEIIAYRGTFISP